MRKEEQALSEAHSTDSKMAEQVSPELARSNEELLSSYSLEGVGKESQEELDVLQDQGGQNYIEVTCGDATGGLFLEKLRRMPNRKALEKCILSNNLL